MAKTGNSTRMFLSVPLLLPAVIAGWIFIRYPYFPREYDDMDYWVQIAQIAKGRGVLGILNNAYLVQGRRPVLMAQLGLPLYLLTGSVSGSTGLLMSCMLAAFSCLCFRILRRYTGFVHALICSLALSFLPVVFEGALYYMAELPFMVFFLAGLDSILGRTDRSSLGAVTVMAMAVSLCLRPLEGVFLWGVTLTFLWLSRSSGRRNIAVGTAISLFIAGLWFRRPGSNLGDWVVSSTVVRNGSGSTNFVFSDNLRMMAAKMSAAFTPAGLAVVLAAVALAVYWRRKPTAADAWAVTVGFLPFMGSLIIPNRKSADELRYFLGPAVLCLGYVFLLISRVRIQGAMLAGICLLWSVAVLPDSISSYVGQWQEAVFGHEICQKVIAPALNFGLGKKGTVMVLSDGSFFLPSRTCDLGLVMNGTELHVETPANELVTIDGFFTQRFPVVILLTRSRVDPVSGLPSMNSERKHLLSQVLSEGYQAPVPVEVTTREGTAWAMVFVEQTGNGKVARKQHFTG